MCVEALLVRAGVVCPDPVMQSGRGVPVGAGVLAYAATDNFNLAIPTPAPGGLAEGYWVSATPSVRGLYGTRPFFLTSGDQFRSVPPPAFGSAAFLVDLAEIRTLSDTRTPAQLAEAQLWAARGPQFMKQVPAELIVAYKRTEREAAHILALANRAGFDAGIGAQDRVAADMIAVRIMGPIKLVIVGAPTYFARRRAPRTPRHPRTFDEDVPLDGRRRLLAAFAVFMFAVCFTPVPIEILVSP